MFSPITGIMPVVLTPFHEDASIDWESYARLLDWYIDKGADALFAVCQSSEMHELTLEERVALAKFTARHVKNRIPVYASGHVSQDPREQKRELTSMVDTGVDGVVLVTNRLASEEAEEDTATHGLLSLMTELPRDLPLGLYECPAPYRRLLTDDQIKLCADSGRFTMLKDVSCDLEVVARRVEMSLGSPLSIMNANAAIAWPAMQAGASGFGGVFNNIHPDLYKWLYREGKQNSSLANELAVFLATSALAEPMGYPALAKWFLKREGVLKTTTCRKMDHKDLKRFWALEDILQRIEEGNTIYRQKITENSTQT